MLKTYIRIALRKLSRERGYVLINIASLALGIASVLVLALYLRSDVTYDRYHHHYEQIYRLTLHTENAAGETQDWAASGPGLGPLLTKDFPQLGKFVRFQWAGEVLVRAGDKERMWDTIRLTDPSVFEVFTHEVIYGDVRDALRDMNSVAVSETYARFYFGDRNPVGETLTAANGAQFKIALVFKDLPDNVHLRYDMLASIQMMESIIPGYTENYAQTLWDPYALNYLMVPEGFDPAAFDAITTKFVDTYMGERARREKMRFSIVPQRLDRIHFGPRIDMDERTGNVLYVYGFAAVACFILIIACINYVNLATARAMKRAKEIGMRKVLGASQSQLIAQFLGESAVVTTIALLLAVGLVYLALSTTSLGGLMGKQRLAMELATPSTLLWVPVLGVLIALAAGLYPAFVLASISPMSALTLTRRSWRTGLSLRHGLVFLQMAISIAVIAATLTMLAQMRYVREKPLGFDAENRLIVTVRGYDVAKQLVAIMSELRRQPGVRDVTTISIAPGTGSWDRMSQIESNASTMEPLRVQRLAVGLNFVEAMNLDVIAGRAFDDQLESDVRDSVLVNETLVRRMGWTQPIGKRVEVDQVDGLVGVARVVGVVKDFHYASLYNSVAPIVISAWPKVPPPPPSETLKATYRESFIVVVDEQRLSETFAAIEKTIRTFDPTFNFEPLFLADAIVGLYQFESNLAQLTALFAGICIVISVMGIFGLTAFATEHRRREIGIRKVLGATDGSIVLLLGRPLLWMVVLAAVPSCYLCYEAIRIWLARFAYRADIGVSIFVLATGLIATIALVTVAIQALRTARANPVDALRYE